MRDLGRVVSTELVGAAQDILGERMRDVSDVFVEFAHVRTGRFRGSLEAYTGEPPIDDGQPEGLPFYAPPGHDQIDRVVADWKPGQDIGFVDNVEYAEHAASLPPDVLELMEEAATA